MHRIARFVAILGIVIGCACGFEGVGLGQASNTWTSAGQMTQVRTGAAAVLLSSGQILITGGADGNGVPLATAEFYSPSTGTFSAAPSMNTPRAHHAAIVLTTGDVLVTGGVTDSGGDYATTAEIFSVASQQWTLLQASLGTGLAGHAMANLSDGNVLIAGGVNTTGPINYLMLYNATNQSISNIGTLITARSNAVAAATPDGRVLIAGGTDINNTVLNSTEIFVYNPNTLSGIISAGPLMTYPRTAATATTTYDGVAIVGGNNGQQDLGTAEIFSQWTNAFRVVNGGTPRSSHFAVMLPKNGSVLAMGGTGGQAVDQLQPWANSTAGAFVAGASSLSNHSGGFAAPLTLGSLLAAGGQGALANAAEFYWFPTIATDQPDYAPGTPVVMTGTGFRPGEVVDLHLHEWVNQTTTDIPEYTATADNTGTISFMGYAPTTTDIGARYHLTAAGESSGFQAQTIFTDASPTTTVTVSGTGSITITRSSGTETIVSCAGSPNVGSGSCTVNSTTQATCSSGTCRATWSANYTANLTATPGVGLNFAGWSGGCTGTTTCTASANGNGDFAATATFFAPQIGSVTVGGQVGTLTFGTAGSATYTVTVNRAAGTNTAYTANLTVGALPSSVSAGFSPSTLSFAAGDTAHTSTLTLSTTSAAAAESATSFAVTATNSSQSLDTKSGNGSLSIGKSTPTLSVTNSPATYSGITQAATVAGSVSGTVSNVTYTGTSGTTYGPTTTAPTGVGTYAVTANFAPTDSTDYNSLTAASAGNFIIAKATATLTVTNTPVTYNGNPQTATVSAGAVAGTVSNVRYNASATVPTSAGTYAITADFTPTDTTDYNTLTGVSAGNFVINKATPTLTVTNSPVTYTGSPQAATVSAGSVAGTVSNVRYNGSATAPTTVGTYTITANFVPTDTTDYNSVTAGSAGSFVIGKASPTLTVTNSPVTYTGNPQAATVSSGGVAGTVSSVKYNGSATAPTSAGTYAITANFTPTDTTDYNSVTGGSAGNFVINQATPTLTVTNSPVTYNGNPQAATVSAGAVAGTVSNILYSGSATVPTSAGIYAITANFTPTDTNDYNTLTGVSAGSFVINKATPTLSVTNSPVTYSGSPQAATVAGSVPGTASNILYNASGTVPTNAGTYAITASFTPTDSTDYNSLSGVAAGSFVINKAAPTVSVTAYSVTYDGNPHTANGSATGVKGETLSGLNLSGTTHTNAGTYNNDAWTFTDGTGNYTNANGTVNDVINKAAATINVTPYSVTYDGNPHTATGTATGAKGETLSGLSLSGTAHTTAGTYNNDPWTFTDGTANYTNASGTVNDVINKVTTSFAALTASQSITYGTAAINLSGRVNGYPMMTGTVTITANLVSSGPLALSGNPNNFSGTIDTHALPSSAIPYLITYSYSGDANSSPATDVTTTLTVNKATPTITWATPAPITYGTALSSTQLNASSTVAGTFVYTPAAGTVLNAGSPTLSVTLTPADITDYNSATKTVTLTVNKATPTVSVTNSPVTFNGSPQTAAVIGSVPGSITGILYNNSATVPSSAGTYSIKANFTPDDSTDYNSLTAAPAGDFVINPAAVTITAGSFSGTYDGNTHALSACTSSAPSLVTCANSPAGPVGPNVSSGNVVTPSPLFGQGSAADYSITPVPNSWSITPASSTVTVSFPTATNNGGGNFSATYTSNPFMASAVVSGLGSGITQTVTWTGCTTITMVGTCTATANYAGDANHSASSGSATLTIGPALPNVSWAAPADIFYGTMLSATQLNATSNVPGTLNYTPAAGTILAAGAAQPLSVHFAPTDALDYTPVDLSVNINVLQATPIIAWGNPSDISYGTALSSTQLDATALPPATALTGSWLYSDASNPPNAVDSVSGNNGALQGNTATVTGQSDHAFSFPDVAGDGVIIPSNSGYDLTSSGFTAAFWMQGSSNSNGQETILEKSYDGSTGWTFQVNSSNGILAFDIGEGSGNFAQVLSTANILDGIFHYIAGSWDGTKMSLYVDGVLQNTTTLTGSPANNTGGLNIGFSSGGGSASQYFQGTVDAIQIFRLPLPAGSYAYSPAAGTVLNAGNGQTLSVSFTPTDSTDLGTATASASINVKQATANITVNSYTVTYDASPHTATATATGVGNLDLSSDFDLSGTTHTNAGTYTDTWIFHDSTGNYANASGTISDVINQAKATINVTAYNVTYDATAHTATGTASGVGNVDLSADLVLTGTTHTGAGNYTDTWNFHDSTGNYADGSGSVNDVIGKANAAISVTAYNVMYDATAHTAAGTATGVGGVSLGANLNLSGTVHTNAGTYNGDAWTFTDTTGNYNNASGTVDDSIAKANASIIVTPYSLTYDGSAHTATGTATGVKNESLNGLNVSGTTHTNAGTYSGDAWTFTDVTGNYNNANGTVTDFIDRANANIVVTGYTATYDGNMRTAMGTATGVGGAMLSGLDLSGTMHSSAGDYPSDPWTFTDITGNYKAATGTVHDTINKAPLTVTAADGSRPYGQPNPAFTGTLTGVIAGDGITASYASAAVSNTPVGTYGPSDSNAIVPTLNDPNSKLGNYAVSSTNGTLAITAVPLYVISPDHSRPYGGVDSPLTPNLVGLTGGDTASTVGNPVCSASASSTSAPGTYAIVCSGVTSNNYVVTYVNGTLTVTDPLNGIAVSPNPSSVTYGGSTAFTPQGTYASSATRMLANAGGESYNLHDLSSTRTGAATAEAQGKLYSIGGLVSGSPSNTVEAYDPATDSWTAVANLNNARTNARAASVAGKVYVFGGCSDAACTSLVSTPEVYDPATNSWTAISATRFTPRSSMAVAVLNDKVYVAGGQDSSGNPVSTVEVYDPGTNGWSSFAPLLKALGPASGVVVNGNLYVIGIVTGNAEVEEFTSGAWKIVNSGTQPLADAAAAVLNNLIYAVDGSGIHAYDPSANTWTDKTGLSNARMQPQAVTLANLIYVAGDTASGAADQNSLEAFASDEAQWSSSDATVSSIDQSGKATGLKVGNTTITATSIQSPTISGNSSLTVNPATLMVKADAQTKVYGQSDPALTYKVGGLQFSDTQAAVLTGSLARDADEAVTSAPGYAIKQGTLVANDNYTISYTGNYLSITPATLTVTADPQTKVYGQNDPSLTYKVMGLQFSDTPAAVLSGALTRVAGESVAGGPYAISQGTLKSNGNYAINFTGNQLTINPAPLTVTASSGSFIYGGTPPAITATYSGFVNGDTYLSLTTQPTCSTTAKSTSHVSGNPYSSSCSGASDSNYMISYLPGTVTVNPAPMSITASSGSFTYGGTVHSITASLTAGSAFVNGDGVGSLVGLACTTTATSASHVSGNPYTSSCSGSADSDYAISYVPGTVTVNPALLSITASSGSFTYGGTVPTIKASYSGLVNGDTFASLTTAPACSTTATSSSPVSPPTYVSSCSAAADPDYTIGYTNGAVTVTQAPLTVTASSGVMTFGTAGFIVTPLYGGFVNGEGPSNLPTAPACGPAFSNISPAGSYPTSCTGLALDGNYGVTYIAGNVVVTPADTQTTVSSSVNPSTYMQLVTFTAVVTDISPGSSAIPAGTVTFTDAYNNQSIAICSNVALAVVNGQDQATCSTTTLGDASTNNVVAAFAPNPANFNGSSSTVLAQVVNPAPAVTLSPLSVSFGNTNIGSTSSSSTVTLGNAGDAALSLGTGAIAINGPNANDFAFTTTCGSSLGFASGANSCKISIVFKPTDTGVETATLQITDNDDNATNAQQFVSLTGSGLSTIPGTSLYTNAIFGTSNACGAITFSGGSSVDSFNSMLGYSASKQNAGGNVGTNGNVTLNGSNSAIYGSAAVDNTSSGSCSKSSVPGLTSNGGAKVTGGLIPLNGPITYPVPPSANPVPPTTSQAISGSCPAGMTGCTNNGSKVVSLSPGQYGNVTASGGTTIHVSKGKYNLNSLTLSGKSIVTVDSGPVVINIAGASLNSGSPAIDLSGGSIVNPSHIPGNMQFAYGGSHGVNLTGGADSYAVLYAPSALVNMSGGTDFFGSIIGSTVTSSGGTAVHYDTNLPNIQSGNYIWFTAVVNNLIGLPASQQAKLYLTNASVTFTANGTQYTEPVPNGVVTFNSSVQSSGAKTGFDLTNNRWSTNVAKNGATGNTFVTGFAFPVPVNFPTGIQNVTFSAAFSTDTPGITMQWQWNAAVYTQFSNTYATTTNSNVLGVNSEDGTANANGTDPAGTPETCKQYATFGATGGYSTVRRASCPRLRKSARRRAAWISGTRPSASQATRSRLF